MDPRAQRLTANDGGASAPSGVRLDFHARQVQAVLGGRGTLTVHAPDGDRTVSVDGTPRSYVLLDGTAPQTGTIEVTASPGLELYSFTFG